MDWSSMVLVASVGEFCEERAGRTELQNVCWNNCQGRGTCRRGFCHCKAGWWGKDCSSSKVYAPHSARRPVHKLRVYVYELPWTVRWLGCGLWLAESITAHDMMLALLCCAQLEAGAVNAWLTWCSCR